MAAVKSTGEEGRSSIDDTTDYNDDIERIRDLEYPMLKG